MMFYKMIIMKMNDLNKYFIYINFNEITLTTKKYTKY
jgi:hypothetical protein